MRSQIKLGRIMGIRIGLHYSWFLIALLIIFSLAADFRAGHPQWSSDLIATLAVTAALLFFVSLLLHELAHSLVAKSRGIPVREITLFALGGVSQIEGEASTANIEFWMALAGPLTSLVIGLACLGGARMGSEASAAGVMFSRLGYINLALAAFNMVPGYPLDGGRILRSIAWWKTGDMERATYIAARVGQIVAGLFIAIGIFQFFGGAGLGGLWIAFIGWFLLQAAGDSYAHLGLTRALASVHVGDVMTHECPAVDGEMNLQEFVDGQVLRTGGRCFVVMNHGAVAGMVTPSEIRSVDRARWPQVTLRQIMRPLAELHTVTPEASLSRAMKVMNGRDLNQLPVMSHGLLSGILTRSDVLRYLQTRQELRA